MNARVTAAYLAPDGFTAQLEAELGKRVVERHDRLYLATGHPEPAVWAQNTWYEPEIIGVASIGAAAKALKERQRNWAPYTFHLHRRSELIQEQLPYVNTKPLPFPAPPERFAAPLGSWSLLGEKTLICAPRCSNPFANGAPDFIEFKDGPPSRAYLKLFEALTLFGKHPQPGERCLELGASPGGWTWVLGRLGASVTAVDRAALDPAVAALPGVTSKQGDAFAVKPDAFGPVDWLFSDVICYPGKLLEYVKVWLAAGAVKHVICTLKFQGDEHYDAIEGFAALTGARVVHLHHNKHELTAMISAGPSENLSLPDV